MSGDSGCGCRTCDSQARLRSASEFASSLTGQPDYWVDAYRASSYRGSGDGPDSPEFVAVLDELQGLNAMLAPSTATTFRNVEREAAVGRHRPFGLEDGLDGDTESTPNARLLEGGAASKPMVHGLWRQYLYWWDWLRWVLGTFPVEPEDPSDDDPEPPPGGGPGPGGGQEEPPRSVRGYFNPNQWTIWDQIDAMTNPPIAPSAFTSSADLGWARLGTPGTPTSIGGGWDGWLGHWGEIAAEAGSQLATKRCCVVPGFPKVVARPDTRKQDQLGWVTRTAVRLRDDAACSCQCCDVRQYISIDMSRNGSDGSRTSVDFEKLVKEYRSKEGKRVFSRYPFDFDSPMQHDSGRWYFRQTADFRGTTPVYRFWVEDVQWGVSHLDSPPPMDAVDAAGLASEYLEPAENRLLPALPLSVFDEDNVTDRYGARPDERGHSQALSRWDGDCRLTMRDTPFFRAFEDAESHVTFWFTVIVRPSYPRPIDPNDVWGEQCRGGRAVIVRYRLSQSAVRKGSASANRGKSKIQIPRKHRAPW